MDKKRAPTESASKPVDVEDEIIEGVEDAKGHSSGKKLLPGELFDRDIEVLPAETQSAETQSRGLVRYDPLLAYLREIRSIKRLSKEEEQALAVRYRENGDLRAAYELVASNLWLVVKIARDYERAARSVMDLIQEGNIGLMEAVKNFDPYREVRFPSYAVWWVKAYIIRYVIANWRMVKIGTTQAQRKLFFNLQKEKERLEREGFTPSPKLIAQQLQVKESDVIEMEQRLASADLSVDAPVQGGEGDFLSLLPADERDAESLVSEHEIRILIQQAFEEFKKSLNEKEQLIFERRLLNEEKATLHELSEELLISKERVRQIENKIKDKLREFLKNHYNQSLDELGLI